MKLIHKIPQKAFDKGVSWLTALMIGSFFIGMAANRPSFLGLGVAFMVMMGATAVVGINRSLQQRPRVASTTFINNSGDRRPVDGVKCYMCTNHFWIEHARLEPPTFCPYCGFRFQNLEFISSEQFDSELDDSH